MSSSVALLNDYRYVVPFYIMMIIIIIIIW